LLHIGKLLWISEASSENWKASSGNWKAKLEGFFRESEGFLGRSGKLLAKNTLYTYQVSEKELCLGLAELHLWQSSRMKHDIIFKDTYQWRGVYFTSS